MLWNQIKQLHLTINMQVAAEEIAFAQYLLELGNGTASVHPEVGEDMIEVPKQYLVETIDELIEKVFPDIQLGYSDKYFVSHQAILTPINVNVDKMNESIMEKNATSLYDTESWCPCDVTEESESRTWIWTV